MLQEKIEERIVIVPTVVAAVLSGMCISGDGGWIVGEIDMQTFWNLMRKFNGRKVTIQIMEVREDTPASGEPD